MKKKIKKNDKVKVLIGKDKGKISKVIKTFRDRDYALVEKINIFKKHVKPRGKNAKGEIKEIVKPIHISNLMLVDSKGAATRVAIKTQGNKKVRYSKKNNIII